MKLRDYQQSLTQEALALLEEKYAANFGKTFMLRSIMRGSGKHIQTMENIKRVYPDYNMHDSGLNWPAICVYDEIDHDDTALARERDLKFRAQKVRGAMSKSTTLIDIKQWLHQSVFTLNRIQRHPTLMTLDDWRAISSTDVYYKAAYVRAQPQACDFNRLLTIYWHNYYMDDLQGTLHDDKLSMLSNGYRMEAYELFNTVPRLTYVRYCIAKAIIHRGNNNATAIDTLAGTFRDTDAVRGLPAKRQRKY